MRILFYFHLQFFLSSCREYVELHQMTKLRNRFPKRLRFFVYIENFELLVLQVHLKHFLKTNLINFLDFKILSRKLHMSTPFVEIRDVVITTPGDLYSPYEKLLLPFDDLTWKLLNFTFLIAFVAIFIINQLPKFIRDRIYGKNTTTPTLNVISTFFGTAQCKLPTRSIPLFILIVFVFFCLIFRTCYQSKLFEFLSSSPRRPSPSTVEGLKDRSYTIYSTFSAEILENLIEKDKHKW